MPRLTLAELGWNSGLADNLPPGLEPGRITAAHRAAFDVQTAEGAVRTRLPGRLVQQIDLAVGDWVGLGEGLIRTVLPRRSAIVRNAPGRASISQTLVANVDLALLVSSLGPDLEPRRLERYLIAVWESGAAPEIVLTKADRFDEVSEFVVAVEAVGGGVPIHVVSALTGEGCEALRTRLRPGTTTVMLGSSGVGKSTLLNRFAGRELMATTETRADDDAGRHTTSRRELHLLPGGGVLIDTPGLRELQLWEAEGFDQAFADVAELAADCRYNDCSHTHEPDCAVQGAVDDGALPLDRLRSYRKLERELAAAARRRDARLRAEELRRWKLITRDARARTRRR